MDRAEKLENATNPMAGSGMQKARNLRAEETVEVVRDHEGGTGVDVWQRRPEGANQLRLV